MGSGFRSSGVEDDSTKEGLGLRGFGALGLGFRA